MKKREMTDQSPPYYFIVVFWGEQHRNFFVNYSLASLLSENNIPALERDDRNRFLISTTREDWQAIQELPLFKLLSSYVTPEWLELAPHKAETLLYVYL